MSRAGQGASEPFASQAGCEAPAHRELARAKVNLTLRVLGRRADGYHELESLVLFADFGDEVSYSPALDFSLSIGGPFAAALDGADGNLLARAAAAYAGLTGAEPRGAFHLTKKIPVAAGLGGGSADAAAALRLLAAAAGPGLDAEALMGAAGSLGADVPCCLLSRAAIMTGIGDRLHPLPAMTPTPAVLVNPGLPLATADVFRALQAPLLDAQPMPPDLPRLEGPSDLAAYANARSNDLEPPALRLLPVIAEILEALATAPGALLARLSGSGPTCFAIFADPAAAQAAAAAISAQHPPWWVQPVNLS